MIEVWDSGQTSPPAYSGRYYVELNANEVSTLFQQMFAMPRGLINISFAHRGRQGVDSMTIDIGPSGGPYVSYGPFATGNTAWGYYVVLHQFAATAFQTYDLRFTSFSSASPDPSIGNFIDSVDVKCPHFWSLNGASLEANLTYDVQPALDSVITPGISVVITLELDVEPGSSADAEIWISQSSPAFMTWRLLQVYPKVPGNLFTSCPGGFANRTGAPDVIEDEYSVVVPLCNMANSGYSPDPLVVEILAYLPHNVSFSAGDSVSSMAFYMSNTTTLGTQVADWVLGFPVLQDPCSTNMPTPAPVAGRGDTV